MTARELMTRALAWCIDPENAKTIDYRGGTGFTATDIYHRMRADLWEQEFGGAYGSSGLSGGSMGYRIPGGTLDDVRTWLFSVVRSGVLEMFHPSGKRTSTGLRFRVAGTANEVDAKREAQRAKKAERGTVVHAPADRTVPQYQTQPLCRPVQKGPAKATYYRSNRRRFVYGSGESVNCVHCLRKLPKLEADHA